MVLSKSQLQIFQAIVTKEYKRNIIICPTQYGKSLTVALAVLCCVGLNNEKWVIVAPSEKKARIVMNYITEHIFDDPVFYTQLDVAASKERLKKEASKKRITFKNGGEVSILTVDARNSKKNIEAAMGFGSPNVILDESSLIGDVLYATVKRMLGGHKENFMLEIGNPFYRNHFYNTWEYEEKYNKIFIDYHQAIKEERFTQDFIEEMRSQPLFEVFYECKFPTEDDIDQDGYRQLITEKMIQKGKIEHSGPYRLGIDVGGGGDYSVGVLRSDTFAEVVMEHQSSDIMTNVTEVESLVEKYKIKPENVFIDDTGIGKGVSDRLKEKKLNVTPVIVGSKAEDSEKFMNRKAELSWNMRDWLKNSGKVVNNDIIQQLSWYKYKIQSDRQIKMEAKQDLKKRTGKSPDHADALMLTFMPVVELDFQFI